MINVKKLNLVGCILLLAACGGGGSGGETGGDDGLVPAVETTDVSGGDSDSDSGSTAKLVADNDFNFSSSYPLSLEVKGNQSSRQRLGLSLCPDYSQKNGQYSVVYEACILKAAFSEGAYSSQVEVAGAVESLLLVIWYFDEPGERDYFEWSREGPGPYRFTVER